MAEKRLGEFLFSIRGRADSLYILGDLFEFWFEYHRVVPFAGMGVLAQLAELQRLGTRVVFLRGNHDVWYQGVLKREFGFDGFYDELRVVIDGKRVFMMHGDALDRNFVPKVFRFLMRNRLNSRLFSLLHPDIGIGMARWIARRSREMVRPMLADDMRNFARQRIEEGFDLVVMGHSHLPELVQFGEGFYLNTGDWLGNFTYGVLEDGKVSLERYQ